MMASLCTAPIATHLPFLGRPSLPVLFIATASSLALMLLGSSLGLAVASPWSHEGFSAVALTAHAAIWLGDHAMGFLPVWAVI